MSNLPSRSQRRKKLTGICQNCGSKRQSFFSKGLRFITAIQHHFTAKNHFQLCHQRRDIADRVIGGCLALTTMFYFSWHNQVASKCVCGKTMEAVVLMVNRNKHMKITDIPFPFPQYLYIEYHNLAAKVEGSTARCISYFYSATWFSSLYSCNINLKRFRCHKVQFCRGHQSSVFVTWCTFGILHFARTNFRYLQNYCTQWIIQAESNLIQSLYISKADTDLTWSCPWVEMSSATCPSSRSQPHLEREWIKQVFACWAEWCELSVQSVN